MEITDFVESLPADAKTTSNIGKFSAKMTFEERCAVLAFYKLGIKRDVVSLAFGIDKRTVSHICSPNSVHYRDVRREFTGIGKDDFIKKYVNADNMAKVQKAAKEYKAPTIDAPTPNSNTFAGTQAVQPEQCSYIHKLEIKFLRAGILDYIDADGWYYRDTTSDDPERWLHNGPESMRTSKTCYDAALENLMD